MYQIGEFSKICQVSVKTLRHYDRLGLLKPVEVDPATGYRYYDSAQLARMLLIRRLKRYGFSLEEILSLLLAGNGADFRAALAAQRKKLLRERMELELVIRDLTVHLQTMKGECMSMNTKGDYAIELVETPPMSILSVRRTMGVDDFGQFYGALYERMGREGLTPDGVSGAMYHDESFNREASDIELFAGIRQTEKADRVIAPRLCAKTVHRGAYSTLPEAYAALVAWIEENGYRWNDAPYDVYTKTARDGLAPQDWETEVYFPVVKAGDGRGSTQKP